MAEFDRDRVVALLDTSCDAAPLAVDAIQKLGLASLLTGRPATLDEIKLRSGLERAEVDAGVSGLTAAGRIEIDDDRVVGVGGLTITSSVHTLALPDATLHTWCALDVIGIPVALGIDADASTSCPQCDEPLRVEIRGGVPVPDDNVRLFCPTAPCSDVRADFCSAANLFCNEDHLAAWIADHGETQGETLDLVETADLGRAMWNSHRSD